MERLSLQGKGGKLMVRHLLQIIIENPYGLVLNFLIHVIKMF